MRLAAALILAALAAAPAQGQPVPADPIDRLLRPPPKDVDVEEPDTAATGSAVEPEPDLAGRPAALPPRRASAPPDADRTGLCR